MTISVPGITEAELILPAEFTAVMSEKGVLLSMNTSDFRFLTNVTS
jgi:hypothetical protein